MSLLDRIHSLAAIEALDPDAYAGELAAQLPPASTLAELVTRDATLVAALHAVDDAITRVMRIRLDHALAADTSIAAPTRRVFASTIASYEHTLPVLASRARDAAARGGARDPDALAESVVGAARDTLALRAALRTPVLALVRDLATAAIPEADRHARDTQRDDNQRLQWSAARRDLEAIAEEPARILAAAMPARLAAWPAQLDEPAAKPEPTLAELIELD